MKCSNENLRRSSSWCGFSWGEHRLEPGQSRLTENVGGTSIPLVLDADDVALSVAVIRRNAIARERNDQEAANRLVKEGVLIARGTGRIVWPGVIAVGDEEFGWSDGALSANTRPNSIAIIGGGPVGCELAQLFARFGTRVFLIAQGGQIADREHPDVAERLAQVLAADGVVVKLNTNVTKLSPGVNAESCVRLSDGTLLTVERVILAVGRHPNSANLGLEELGIETDERDFISIDASCRVVG